MIAVTKIRLKLWQRAGRALLICLATIELVGCAHETPQIARSWDPKAAAAYLDYREGWWTQWNAASRDHGTFCVSCHTALPYALARPALRAALKEPGPSINERKLVENVIRRVRLWNDIRPYYSDRGYDHKSAESRGTEAVLNALILASHDAAGGRLTEDTRIAFENLWSEQQTEGDRRGSWLWLQFDQEPWEANDSAYYGAALAAMAVGTAPENYRARPEIQQNIARLHDYLVRESPSQSTMNRVFLLWASTRLPGLLSQDQRSAIVSEILKRQRRDGGWRLASISWRWNGWTLRSFENMWLREDGTPMEGKSDGAATGLIVLVLQAAGVPRENVHLQRGRLWLVNHQDVSQGFWPASSVNKRRHMSSETGLFMTDAATAFAVLALAENPQSPDSLAASNH